MKMISLEQELKGNLYPGRGIVIGRSADGTKAVEPGISRRSVHLCAAPGGQMQWFLQLIDISSIGRVGFS